MNKKSKFYKYREYLNRKHDWDNFNCITVIEDIYRKYTNVTLDASWDRMGKGKVFNKQWRTRYDMEVLVNELNKYWQKIDIKELQEFDLLFFILPKTKNRIIVPNHFGMYIDQNKFIHVPGGMYCTFSELDNNYRNVLQGCYRHGRLV